MITVEAARKIILAEIRVMGREKCLLSQTLGRTLAEELVSPLNHPPWDTSAMDGYAVRKTDIPKASPSEPRTLKVIETIPAGRLPEKELGPGEVAKIMTGAPLPEGADAIVRVEDTEGAGEEVSIFVVPEDGEFIRRKGEAVRVGDAILKRGIQIRPAEIAMMASVGKSVVPVFQKPRVAILSTGDELADLDEVRGPEKILNSNGYGLAAQVSDAGGVPISLGIAKDTHADLIEKLKEGLHADIILASGGVSMGDYDFVIEVLKELGAEMKFWKVSMKPGRPLAFGVISGKPVFGLPGNPVSSMVSFEQFVRPAILLASGRNEICRPTMKAVLKEEIRKRPGRRLFLRAVVSSRGGELSVCLAGDQDSAVLMSLVKANAFMILPEEGDLVKSGEEVTVQFLSDIHMDDSAE
ncbi:MAG TPA: molybdopterin molybdenumtransferase MoeA [Nitrospiria bacterium]|nr:molybdopterin molybdotransferase MoeA [Candidatus Manganitrophaceae bacterium]HIL35605.1 molybdopterin molybdenumtransferase MoeA [Candidatus Manganitrophaceae bacterium]